jgi:hypothetical protein
MAEKDVFKSRDGKNWVESKECHPRQLALTSRYIAPYWYDAIKSVSKYEKERGLQEVHKLIDDRRIQNGINLHRNGHIKESVVTKHGGGDVRAIVLSEDKKTEYTVLVKNYLPETLPQYNYEREKYIANLFVDCQCSDHHLSHYRDNSSMMCKHIIAILFLLIDKFDMPKIFVLPEERITGYQKSDTEELEVNINALPLVNFRQYINILLLKKFRGVSSALGVSVHRISNDDNQEIGKPQWLTYTETEEVERLIKGISKGYREMLKSKGMSDEGIDERLRVLTMRKPRKKRWIDRLFGGKRNETP